MLIGQKVVAAVIAATVCPVAVCANPVVRPAVIQQERDDDCGAAALAMLMKLAGHDVTEAFLLQSSGIIVSQREKGLSAGDLVRITEKSGTGLILVGQMVKKAEFSQYVAQHPVMVLLVEKNAKAGFGHFVTVEAYHPELGYLVADPAIGKRGFIKESKLMSLVPDDTSTGTIRMLALRLMRDGQSAISPAPLAIGEEKAYSMLDTLRRSRRALSSGKTFVTLEVGQGRQRLTPGGDQPFAFSARQSTASLSVRRGLGDDFELGVSLGVGQERGSITLGNDGFVPLERRTSAAPLSVSVSQTVEIDQSGKWTAFWGGGLGLKDGYKPRALSASVGVQRQIDKFSITGLIDVQYVKANGQSSTSISPAIDLGFDIGDGFMASAQLATVIPLNGGQPVGDLGLGLGKQIGKNWAVEAQFSHSIFGPSGYRASQFGLAITFALPNRLKMK